MKDFELVVSLNKKEYLRATFMILTKIGIIRIIPIFILIPVLFKVLSDVKNDSVSLLTYLFPLLPFVIVIILIYRVSQKSYAQNKDQLDDKKFIFSQDRLRIEVGEVNSEFPKSNIQKSTETQRFIFIWTAKNSAQVIPKSQITEQELQNVRDFCNPQI